MEEELHVEQLYFQMAKELELEVEEEKEEVEQEQSKGDVPN